jgi:predicted CXXCH cytochrome family protein
MKKLLLMTGIVVAVVLGLAGLASADGGPHGGYTATTDGCAGCHRAHTAPGPRLLVDNGTFDLCVSCHGSTGTGANTNVDDGFYLSTRDDGAGDGDVGAANTPDNAPLLGGGFVNYQGVPVTSSHDPTGVEVAAWGNGVARGTTADLAEGLSCASCHDPHGSPNYRIMNETINGSAVVIALVDEGAAKDYDTEQWDTGTSTVCAACHEAYHRVAPGQGSTLDGGSYTHRIDMTYNYGGNVNPETVGLGGYTLPLAESGVNDMVVCMTCHLPHGSSAQMTGIADGAGLPGNTSATDSALLRLDNRGVCEVCHQK